MQVLRARAKRGTKDLQSCLMLHARVPHEAHCQNQHLSQILLSKKRSPLVCSFLVHSRELVLGCSLMLKKDGDVFMRERDGTQGKRFYDMIPLTPFVCFEDC